VEDILLYQPMALTGDDNDKALVEDKVAEHRFVDSLVNDLRWQDPTKDDYRSRFS